MNDKLSVSEFAKLLPDLFKDGKQISFNPQGKSMLPTIKEGDTVIFERCSRVRRYDIKQKTSSFSVFSKPSYSSEINDTTFSTVIPSLIFIYFS